MSNSDNNYLRREKLRHYRKKLPRMPLSVLVVLIILYMLLQTFGIDVNVIIKIGIVSIIAGGTTLESIPFLVEI